MNSHVFLFFAFQISQMGVQDAQIINKLENKLFLSWLLFSSFFLFLAPLAEGQRAIVMALCPSCVHPFVRACVRKLFL